MSLTSRPYSSQARHIMTGADMACLAFIVPSMRQGAVSQYGA